jgi:hypothetical protein
MIHKTILSTLALFVLISFSAMAQTSSVDKIFDKYAEMENFTSVDIAKGLFELFADIDGDDEEFEDFKKAVEGIEKLRLISYSLKEEDSNEKTKSQFYNEIMETVPFNEFELLMIVKETDQKIEFFAKSDEQIITEMLMLVNGDEETILLSLSGNIDLNYITKLGSTMNMGGMEHLKKMKSE